MSESGAAGRGGAGDGDLENLTERARRALASAGDEARRLGAEQIGLEYLLLGLLGETDSPPARIFLSRGVDLARARSEVARLFARTDPDPAPEMAPWQPALSREVRRALGLAREHAGSRARAVGAPEWRAGGVDTMDLLIGTLRAAEGQMVALLHALGMDPSEADENLQRRSVSMSGPLTPGGGPRRAAACPQCGRPLRPQWKHCVYCGATVIATCPNCGFPRQNVPGEAFCHNCGAPLQPPPDLPTMPPNE